MKKLKIEYGMRIGVEVEMTGLTRADAASIIARTLGGEVTHAGGGLDRYRIRTTDAGTWTVCSDSSICPCSGETVEVVTPPLAADGLKSLVKVINALRLAGALSGSDLSCGIHVHISDPRLSVKALTNLINTFNARLPLLVKALAIDPGRVASWCQPIPQGFVKLVNYLKPDTLERFKDLWYGQLGGSSSPTSHYNRSRYHALNLHSFFSGKGIEFRLYDFTEEDGIDITRLMACVYFSIAITEAAIQQKSARAGVPDTDNLKYSMRTWLTRLGFNGEEYKGLREEFTKRLKGDPSFRYGRN